MDCNECKHYFEQREKRPEIAFKKVAENFFSDHCLFRSCQTCQLYPVNGLDNCPIKMLQKQFHPGDEVEWTK